MWPFSNRRDAKTDELIPMNWREREAVRQQDADLRRFEEQALGAIAQLKMVRQHLLNFAPERIAEATELREKIEAEIGKVVR